MTDATRLVPLEPKRARELLDLMHEVQEDESRALALDDQGNVLGIVGAEDATEEHLLRDLDVHA